MAAASIEGTHSVTLIELVIPIVILDILVTEALPVFIDLASDAKNGTLPFPLPLLEHSINTLGHTVDHSLLHGIG
jgi:hypothetical protein